VHSVTSEAVTSVSFQTAPPKPARSDQSSGNDHFGTLVDSSTDTGNDRAASTAQQPSASQRRSDDASATAADHVRSRDATAADQTAQKNSDDRDATAKRLSDTSADSNADADAAQRTRAKSSVVKAGALQSAEKSSSGQISAADAATVAGVPAQQGEPSVTTPNAVAVVIPVAIALVDIPAATPAAGNATAPLAIAAAAIAASSSATSGSAATSAQVKFDAGAAADTGAAIDAIASAAAIGSAAVTSIASDAAATAKIALQAAAAAPVKQQATQTVATAVTYVALATAVAATAPVAPKTAPLKAPVAAPTKTAASSAPDIAPGTPDPSASATPTEAAHNNVAPQPAVAAMPETRNGVADTAKADPSAASSSTSAATAAPHEHSPIIATAPAPTDTSDAGAQATGTIQPQLPAVAATAALAGPLSVTPATNAAVPWSGLALEIAVSARSGKSRFDIRLDPADLGRIDVRIDVDRNGQVTSHLTVEKPETLSMLRQDAPQLQRQLDEAGFKTGNGGLQFSLRDQSSSGQDNGNETGRNAQRLVISDEDTIPAAVAGRTYGRMLGSSSGVDIRV
jgi:flagellar hook-length control protein FliK